MTHRANHKQFEEGFGGSILDLSCEECLEKSVGGLDDKNFQLLTGLTRHEFETYLRAEYDKSKAAGIYNLWYAIMDSKAVKAFARREELQHRIKEKGYV